MVIFNSYVKLPEGSYSGFEAPVKDCHSSEHVTLITLW